MPIATCKRCGRIFNRVRRDICPACIIEEDGWFMAIKTYLHNQNDASLEEVAEATGVQPEYVADMIRDGRLLVRDHPNLAYPCERCKKPTQSGRYCASCSKEIASRHKPK